MTDAPRSRFTLLDAMVLIVAIAVGLAISRTFGEFQDVRRGVSVTFRKDEIQDDRRGVSVRSRTIVQPRRVENSDNMNRETAVLYKPRIKGEFIYWARQIAFWSGPYLTVLSLATIGLGLRRSGSSSSRFLTQPGAATVTVAVLAMGATALHAPNLLIAGSQFYWRDWWIEFWFMLPRVAGFAVATCWVGLAMNGRGWTGGGWPDWLGRVLGGCWVVSALLVLTARWWAALPN